MKIPRRRRRPIVLDMTPMIDCVFQLLIFFMLSSSLISPQIKLTLPAAETRDETSAPETVITVDQQGNFYVNNEACKENELTVRLRPLVDRSKSKIVTFRGDEKVDYRLFIKALDASRQAGASNMNVAHQMPK